MNKMLKKAVEDEHTNTLTDLFEFLMNEFCYDYCKYSVGIGKGECGKEDGCPLISI